MIIDLDSSLRELSIGIRHVEFCKNSRWRSAWMAGEDGGNHCPPPSVNSARVSLQSAAFWLHALMNLPHASSNPGANPFWNSIWFSFSYWNTVFQLTPWTCVALVRSWLGAFFEFQFIFAFSAWNSIGTWVRYLAMCIVSDLFLWALLWPC